MTQDHAKQSELELTGHTASDELTALDLAEVTGGGGKTTTGTPYLVFTFKMVAVKTVGWAHD